MPGGGALARRTAAAGTPCRRRRLRHMAAADHRVSLLRRHHRWSRLHQNFPQEFATFTMADAEVKKPRSFRKFSYRGVDLDALLDMSTDELVELLCARQRRRFQRGLKRKPLGLIKKMRKAKKEAEDGEKPSPVNTHLRNMIVVPEMIGSVVGVYNGKTFNQVEVKPEMVGHYLGEFSISYKPVRHGRPGIGSTNSSRFIPLK